MKITLNKWVMNVNIFTSIVLVIVLFFAAPVVLPHVPVLAILMWFFAAWFSVSTLLLILSQYLIDSIKEDAR